MVNISQARFQRLKSFESSQQISSPVSGKGLPLFLIVFILMVIMVMIFAFVSPVNSVILVNLMQGVDQVLEQGQPVIDDITDTDVRTAINDAVDSGIVAGNNTIEVNAALYRWGWIFFVIILFLVIFLITNSKSTFSQLGLT